jgi:hypothetical protein
MILLTIEAMLLFGEEWNGVEGLARRLGILGNVRCVYVCTMTMS